MKVPKWEILVLDVVGNSTQEQEKLASPGENGWELVSVVSLHLCQRAYFKRPKPEISDPPN
jgi:hypothetical protein